MAAYEDLIQASSGVHLGGGQLELSAALLSKLEAIHPRSAVAVGADITSILNSWAPHDEEFKQKFV